MKIASPTSPMISGERIFVACQGALTPPCVKATVVEQVAAITIKLPLFRWKRKPLNGITRTEGRPYIQSIRETFSFNVPGGMGSWRNMAASIPEKTVRGMLRSIWGIER